LQLYLVADLKHKTLNKNKIMLENENLNKAQKPQLNIAAVSGQLPLGEDMDGNQIFPNDIVLRDGDENQPVRIEYGKYREKFNCGYVIGWYVPDYCKKVER
jgi:hypothetical protein